MFKEKRTLPLLKGLTLSGFQGKRWTYDTGSGVDKGIETHETRELTPEQQREVRDVLREAKIKFTWKKDVSPLDNLKEFAKRLSLKEYKVDIQKKKKEEFIVKLMIEAFQELFKGENLKKLGDANKPIMVINNSPSASEDDKGEVQFFDGEKRIELNVTNVRIKTPMATPEAKPENKLEKKADEKAAMESFKKAFPGVALGEIHLNRAERVPEGKPSYLFISKRATSSADYHDESGTGVTLQPDRLKERYQEARIKSPFIVEAPKKDGTIGKFVLVDLTIQPTLGEPTQTTAWVELGKLKADKSSQKLEAEKIMEDEVEFYNTIAAREYGVRINTPLYSDNKADARKIIRSIKKDDTITVTDTTIYSINNEEFVHVTYEKDGMKDEGWVRKEALYQAAGKDQTAEVAFKAAEQDRANQEMVKKYYDRQTGKIHFDGNREAEWVVTLNDLFPNARGGDPGKNVPPDRIRIVSAVGGKESASKTAYFDPEFTYTRKLMGGKTEKVKGAFIYEHNKQRATILDGDTILPEWEKPDKSKRSQEKIEDRQVVQKVTLNEGETYEGHAKKALALEQIQKAFENSGLSTAEKEKIYINAILKRFQDGNTLYYIVPTAKEVGMPSLETVHQDRGNLYREQFIMNRTNAVDEMKSNLNEYLTKKINISKGLHDAVNDEETWNKIWNGEKDKEMEGLDKLIHVLKHPLFVEAGITESNARQKVLDLIQEWDNQEVDFEDIVNFFGIYRKADGNVGNFNDFKNEMAENEKVMKENEPGMRAFEDKRGKEILAKTEIVKAVQEKVQLAESQGDDPLKYVTPEQRKQFKEAREVLDKVKEDPDYQQWETYRLAASRIAHQRFVLMEGAQLLEAIKHLDVKNFTADIASIETATPETQRCLGLLEEVFKDSEKDPWINGHSGNRKFKWEDVVAGTEEDRNATTEFGRYFDAGAPVGHLRRKLHSYNNAQNQLDGIERITETQTIEKLNNLMKKALLRLIVWKKNPEAVAEFMNRYANSGNQVNLPAKEKGETDEQYAVRVTPMLTQSIDSAYDKLKITSFEDLSMGAASSEDLKQTINDRKDLIKMGYYFDSRDEEQGISERIDNEPRYSLNPMIREIQRRAVTEGGYPASKVQKIESVFLGGIGIKIDTTKPLKQAIGLGVGTGIDLGEGFTLMVSLGVDNIGPTPNPVLGFGIRKEWKAGERGAVGVSAGPAVGLTGASVGASVDGRWPISGGVDMTAFTGVSAGVLVAGFATGIGIGKNYEAAQKSLEKEIGGVDVASIDREKDPEARYAMIINNPKIGPFFRAAAEQIADPANQQKNVLDLYTLWRANVTDESIKQNSAPFISGGGIAAGVAMVAGVPTPFLAPYLTFTFGKKTVVIRKQSEASAMVDKISSAEVNQVIMAEVQKLYSGNEIEIKNKVSMGKSPEVIIDHEGKVAVRKAKGTVDFKKFTDGEGIDKYNEALKPQKMRVVPDDKGRWELQVFGAVGNLQVYADPGMDKRGLVLEDATTADGKPTKKVFIIPGSKPELFITREEFSTAHEKRAATETTIISISDTPTRERAEIAAVVAESAAYLYKKAGMQWEIVTAHDAKPGNVMDGGRYEQVKGSYEGWNQNVPKFDQAEYAAYTGKMNGLKFIKDEKNLDKETEDKLEGFSVNFLKKNKWQYANLSTITPGDTEASTRAKREKLVQLIQAEAKKAGVNGANQELTDLQTNFVISRLMDLSFSELDNAPNRRARFESNLRWSRNTVLLPFFRERIKQINSGSGKKIETDPERLVDIYIKRLLQNVTDEELQNHGKVPEADWTFHSVAGAMGTGIRGTHGFVMQNKYGVLGFNEEDLSAPGADGELARMILEFESPLDTTNDKAMMESVLAKKVMAMPGMWFVLGNDKATQALEGMKNVLAGKAAGAENQVGFNALKDLLNQIRTTELAGGNSFIYTDKGSNNSFEFRINTKVADGAHGRCGNASFGTSENLEIYARLPEQGMIIAAGNEKTVTVTPETSARYIQAGLTGVVVIKTGGAASVAQDEGGVSGGTNDENQAQVGSTADQPNTGGGKR